MFRQSPSRNQRPKGFRIKHVLQICLLVAICFWLMYQIKHSRDKKKEFDAHSTKISLDTQGGNEIVKLGRKDLQPQLEETGKKDEKPDEEVAEDETGEEEDTKHEEEELETKHEEDDEETKHEEEEEENKHVEEEQEEQDEDKTEDEKDEGRGAGDDEIDEHEQEKSDSEVDREDETMDVEEREDSEEKENEEKNDQTEKENFMDEHNRDEVARNAHEAREEQYKADDASSAVTHDTQTIGTENENGTREVSIEKTEEGILDHENKADSTEETNASQKTGEARGEDGETAENGASSNATVKEMISDLANSFSNSTVTVEPNDQSGVRNNSADVSKVLPPQNGTEVTSDTASEEGSNLQTFFPEQTSNSSITSDENQNDTKTTDSAATQNTEETAGGSSNSSNNLENVESQHIRSSSETSADGDRSVNTDAANHNENLDTNNVLERTDESSGSLETENTNEVQHDPIDSSDSSLLQEVKDIRTDLDTLPEIRTEGSNSEESAAE